MKKKIALVNNDSDFLNTMQDLLSEFGGYDSMIIHEGNTAYHLIKNDKPHLIILDIRMEEPETGWKVLDLLKIDPQTSTIPVIVCTASADTISAEKQIWLSEHKVALLPKPFDMDDLFTLIDMSFSTMRKEDILEPN